MAPEAPPAVESSSGIPNGTPGPQAQEAHPDARIDNWLRDFDAALGSQDLSVVLNLLDPDCLWRDLLSFTWNIITLDGHDQIRAMLQSSLQSTLPHDWKRDGAARSTADGTTESWLTFTTAAGVGKAHVRLTARSTATTLFTSMEGLAKSPEKRARLRPKGVTHGAARDRASWLDKRREEERSLGYTVQPYCVIVGGGQAAIGLAARLRQLEVPCIVLEKNERPGDSWRNRYKSLCLHDPVWYDHLPYLPFPDTWPVFTPKDQMGDWLEFYTRVMELNYWSSSECLSASFNEESKEWEVKVHRQVSGEDVVLRPKQLVLATGMSGFPNVPKIPGAENFTGELHHSSKHPGGKAYKGKKAVILGANNSAHDIAADLWENGAAEITMIQRSSTHIIRSDTFLNLFLEEIYSESAVEAGITVDLADRIFASIPYKLMPETLYKQKVAAMKVTDAEFYEKLKSTGFMLDFGADESGIFMKYLRRGSGYYIDVGASQLLIDGEVKIRSGVTIQSLKERSVCLSDGSELEADLVVLATGYGSMNQWAAKLISQEVADKVGKCWGLGSGTTKDPGPWEGEPRNMWKPTQQEGLWFHGGNLHQARHYSLYLALQLKARMEGLATAVYGIPKVHHLS